MYLLIRSPLLFCINCFSTRPFKSPISPLTDTDDTEYEKYKDDADGGRVEEGRRVRYGIRLIITPMRLENGLYKLKTIKCRNEIVEKIKLERGENKDERNEEKGEFVVIYCFLTMSSSLLGAIITGPVKSFSIYYYILCSSCFLQSSTSSMYCSYLFD